MGAEIGRGGSTGRDLGRDASSRGSRPCPKYHPVERAGSRSKSLPDEHHGNSRGADASDHFAPVGEASVFGRARPGNALLYRVAGDRVWRDPAEQRPPTFGPPGMPGASSPADPAAAYAAAGRPAMHPTCQSREAAGNRRPPSWQTRTCARLDGPHRNDGDGCVAARPDDGPLRLASMRQLVDCPLGSA